MYECFIRSGVLTMFFNYLNVVTYRLRPNKKSEGNTHTLRMWNSGCLDDAKEQAKTLKVLCKIHRVNPDAIEDLRFFEVKREVKGMKWLREKINALKGVFA